MLKRLSLGLILFGSLAFPASAVPGADGGNGALIWGMLQQTADNSPNLVYSPHSLEQAISLLFPASREDTAEAIAKICDYPNDLIEFARKEHNLRAALDALRPAVSWQAANAVFLSDKLHFSSLYLSTVKQLGARAEALDFSHATAAAQHINGWVAQATQGKIKSLLEPVALRDAVTVLTNAIYLKATWKKAFDETKTSDQPFHGGGKVKMMHQNGKVLYGEGSDYQVVELPYAGDRLVFDCILPNSRDGLKALRQKLSWREISTALQSLGERTVNLSLPRFKLESTLHLLGPLGAIHFPVQGDYFNMTDGPVVISQVVQKAVIEVEEKGTEASAATAIVMTRSIAMAPTEFCADHPFLYIIRDRQTGKVLFCGQVSKP